MKIAIVDEQKQYYKEISFLCREKMKENNIPISIEVFDNGDEFLKKGKNKLFHCIFLDIKMEKTDGINIKETLEKEKNQAAIIFVTSRGEIMAEAFGRNVYGILEKPFCKRKFEKIYDKVIWNYQYSLKMQIPIINHEKMDISKSDIENFVNDILFIKSEHVYTELYTKHGKFIKSLRKTLKEWELELTGELGFYRIHNSYIIHMKYIKEVKAREIIMKGGQKVSISRGKIKEFRQLYNQYKIIKSIYQ